MPSDLKTLAVQYFDNHPEDKDEVIRAYFAFCAPHFRIEPDAHNFTNGARDCACRWCGRTREQVRYDDLPPQCQNRPAIPEIDQTILGEEKRYFALLEKAKKEVPKLVSKGVSTEQLYQTYGYDEETVKAALE